MYFIKITKKVFDDEGHYYGSVLEAEPIFTGNHTVSKALYETMWHRLRRDLLFKSKLKGQSTPFDAIILFSPSVTPEGRLHANILLNGATPRANDVQSSTKRMIRRMDRLVHQIVFDGRHDVALLGIAKRYETNPKVANEELKSLLKIFCRSKGMFIDNVDLEYALASNKDRRREAHRAEHPEHFK